MGIDSPFIMAYCEECGRRACYLGRRDVKRYFTQYCIGCENDRRFYREEYRKDRKGVPA